MLLLAQAFLLRVLRQHTQRVVSMSREVEEMRRSFEEKLRTFGQAQAQFEQEKKAAQEELKGQHRQEIQELLISHQSHNANYSKDQEKLGQLHKAEVTAAGKGDQLRTDTASNRVTTTETRTK